MTGKSVELSFAKLLLVVARRSAGDRVARAARQAGAHGATILSGRGTVASRFLQMLCLADTEKDLVLVLASACDMPGIVSAVRASPEICRKTTGIGIVLDVNSFIRNVPQALTPDAEQDCRPEGDAMQQAPGHQLIFAIVNAGYADDLMAAARAAGAGGGTILKARGTATEQDARFFGISIVPEKEVLLVLAESHAAPGIFEAVRSAPCLEEPGSGIIFCLPAEDFFPLGEHRP